jgi:membrane AbrB-like protein
MPAGTMFVPLVLGGTLKLTGLIALYVPHWLSIVAYCMIGWTIGLKFRRNLLFPLLTVMPAIVMGILVLIALCALSGLMLATMAGISSMTAYLATTPGGLDSVSALALSANADMPFVVALQTLRLFVVMMVGPAVGRWLARITLA